MSSKSIPPAAKKATDGRKRPVVANGRNGGIARNGNGHVRDIAAPPTGNGNGKRKEPRAGQDGETLDGQPPIETLLGLTRNAAGGELDKKTLLTALLAFRKGDFSARLPIDLAGMDGKIADAFNDVIELNERMSEELERLSRVVG